MGQGGEEVEGEVHGHRRPNISVTEVHASCSHLDQAAEGHDEVAIGPEPGLPLVTTMGPLNAGLVSGSNAVCGVSLHINYNRVGAEQGKVYIQFYS